jgi:isopentenyl-diphosphate delta-isomerase type 1
VPSADEIFDVVDEADRVTSQARRSEVHARKLRHRAVHVFVFNEDGKLFIQKRSRNKDSFPGRQDSSASGHLIAGEDYDTCASRELSEELGLTIVAEELKKHFKLEACPETGWEFVWVYSLQTSQPPHINLQEIESGAFCTLTQIQTMTAKHPDEFAPGFLRVFQEFEQRGLSPKIR